MIEAIGSRMTKNYDEHGDLGENLNELRRNIFELEGTEDDKKKQKTGNKQGGRKSRKRTRRSRRRRNQKGGSSINYSSPSPQHAVPWATGPVSIQKMPPTCFDNYNHYTGDYKK